MPEIFPGDGDPTALVLSEVLRQHAPGAVSGMSNGGPVPPIDFASQLVQHKDRVTKMLTEDRPSSDTVTRAIARAVGGKATYGEAMNALKASERASAAKIYETMDRERTSARAERALQVSESNNALSQLRTLVEMGSKPARDFDTELARFVSQPRDKLAVLNYMDKNKAKYGQINATNAAALARRVAADAFTEGVVTGEKPPTTLEERNQSRYLELGRKMASGSVTPEEQQEYDLLRHRMTSLRSVDGVGLVATPPPQIGTTASPPVPPAASAAPAPLPSGTVAGTPSPQAGVVVPAKTQPLPTGVQENLSAIINASGLLNDMEAGLDDVSVPLPGAGTIIKKGAEYGLAGDKTQKFMASYNQYRLMAQSIIKGVPSNFDVQTLIDTLPQPGQDIGMNRARVGISRQLLNSLMQDTVAFYKGSKQEVPAQIIEYAKRAGINPDTVAPWSGQGDPLQNSINLSRQNPNTGGNSAPAIQPGTRIRFDANGNVIQ